MRCQCNNGFAGDGFTCVTDSDSDGYADFSIASCAGTCAYCKQDSCPFNSNIASSSPVPVFNGAPSATQRDYVFFTGANVNASTWSFTGPNTLSETKKSNPTAQVGPASNVPQGIEYDVYATAPENDAGFFGIVFGAQSSSQFCVAQWKFNGPFDGSTPGPNGYFGTPIGTSQAGVGILYIAIGGLDVKCYYNTPTDYSLYNTNVTTPDNTVDFSSQFELLYHDSNRVSPVTGVQYRFHLSYRPQIGYMRLGIYRASDNTLLVDTGDITNAVAVAPATSQFGVYAFRNAANFGSPSYKCCDGYVAGNGDCLPYTVCTNQQRQIVAPTAKSDRVCA